MDRGWWHHGQGVVAPWTRGGGTMDEGWWHLQTRHDGRMDKGWWHLQTGGGGAVGKRWWQDGQGWWHLQTRGGGTAGRECWYHREVGGKWTASHRAPLSWAQIYLGNFVTVALIDKRWWH